MGTYVRKPRPREAIVSELLQKAFLKFEADSGRRRTLTDFADAIGVNPGAMGHWMKGKRLPGEPNIGKIARATNDNTIYLIMRTLPEDDEIAQIVASWGNLTPEQRRSVLNEVARGSDRELENASRSDPAQPQQLELARS